MYKIAKPLFIKCETPLHAGSGTELGIVDMPIQREKHTMYPKIEGSTVKGCMRAEFSNRVCKNEEDKNINPIDLMFGPDKTDGHAGALGFTDARILLFPVKSMKGVFAWITCRSVLEKFRKELALCKEIKIFEKITDIEDGECVTTTNSKLKLNSKDTETNSKIILEEYTFDVFDDDEANCDEIADYIGDYIGEEESLKEKLVVVSDNDFNDFVNLSTEVITRIRINPETGTVKDGALFTEEYLPCETIMYSLILVSPAFNSEKGRFKVEDTEINEINKSKEDIEANKILSFFKDNKPDVMQIGGNETIGKGIVSIIMKK